MMLLTMLKTLMRVAFRRDFLCACITFPLIMVVIISVPAYDLSISNINGNIGHTGDNVDLMFYITKPQNHKSSRAVTETKTDRLSRINDVCKKHDVPGTVKGLYMYHNVTYCLTYKVASTYWKKIYKFLMGDVSYNVTKPSEISKYETHLVNSRKIRLRYLFSLKDNEEILTSYRFMMTRDPYSRLWSVYVDKFILLDNFFWSRYSRDMKSSYGHANITLLKRPKKFQCLDVTFTEFLNYIAKKGEKKPENLDDHMRPIHYGCNPCFYRPNFVGRVETMTHEKMTILRKLGFENGDEIDDFHSYVKNEISMISDFEFKLYQIFRKSHGDCVTPVSLEEKMIHTFIINGYLPENIWGKFAGILPLGPAHFKYKVIDVFLNSFRNSSVVKQQRERYRKQSYRNVPVYILEKIKNLFKYDFALFGYNPSPDYIFGDRDT